MCGIAGIISLDKKQVSTQRLQQMTDSIIHRGPEGEGFWINESGCVGFGHRRLSIIDLSEAGAQPMHYQNRYTITYNGEIYNYIEIKQALLKRGYSFNSNCDTEVILAAYACYGKDCVQHFDGMFAFAIWDEAEQTLFCARDRFGEKPFYFYNDGNVFIFASEMKALWAAGVAKEANNSMLLNYITLGYTADPADASATFYQSINKLPSANFLQLTLSSTRFSFNQYQYWDLDKETISNGQQMELLCQLQTLLTTSVTRRLRSDVAIGSSLSGGLDSSTIVAVINKLISDNSKQRTFSAVFPGFEKDESKYIKQVVDQYAIESFTTTPTAGGFITDLEKLMHHQEEPFQSSSIYAQYKVYELAKQHNTTVILDGQGADEILAGYNKYYHWHAQELVSKGKWKEAISAIDLAKKNGAKIAWSWKNYLAAYMPGFTSRQLEKKALQQQKQQQYIHPDFLNLNSSKQSLHKPVVEKLNDILYFNTMQFGLEELLRYADRNSMAHSREVRLPFLNHELVQFIFSLSSSYKINNGFTKYILRLLMEKELPSSIVWRKDKIGYEPPQKQWMQHQQVVDQVMESRRLLVQKGILKSAVIDLPVTSLSAHEAANYDWRYLCAAGCLF